MKRAVVEPGDVVVNIKDGRRMTIERCTGTHATCVYHQPNRQVIREEIPIEDLTKPSRGILSRLLEVGLQLVSATS